MCVHNTHATPWGKDARFSRFLEGSWAHGRGSGLVPVCPEQAQRPVPQTPGLPVAALLTAQGLLQRSGTSHLEVFREGHPGCGCGHLLQKIPPHTTALTTYALGILSAAASQPGAQQGCHRGGDITDAASPPSPPPLRPPTKERAGGGGAAATSPLPASPTEPRGDLNQHQFQPPVQEEDELEAGILEEAGVGEELEKELLELEPGHEADLDLDPELELEMEPEPEALLQSALCPVPMLKPEAELDMRPNLESHSEDPRQQGYRIESLHPYTEGLTQQDISRWSLRSDFSYPSSTEEDKVCTDQRSICVQTSKHLFWADKVIQASENSLQRAFSMQPSKRSTDETTSRRNQESVPKDTLCSKKQLQNPSAQPALPAVGPQQPPSPGLSSSSLPSALGLAELINFASSLALASSSKIDLPSLEHMIKAPPQKAVEPSTEPAVGHAAQLTMHKPEGEALTKELLEKPPEAREPQKASKQEGKNFPHPYFDFSKPGVKRATIEGEVNLLQHPAMSPTSQEAVKDSVPGTKKGSPLLLKIHFKLSSPTSPEK
ncbi:LOW QUALITY PROTEIN: spermatogenesis-associated protein 32 [Diceros bicornis minor]|uniref:LOW QUALITY PROTEIN: spermatogenesis-associated protein 32 n=1 Tax=Diceros bicornis minor TaxID=77932 RepID=UPI0026F268EE|nr:LOW QUALITY PROTEIN: spermatogenesis-associated protein 32 [Diceros bicornis minor]